MGVLEIMGHVEAVWYGNLQKIELEITIKEENGLCVSNNNNTHPHNNYEKEAANDMESTVPTTSTWEFLNYWSIL